MGNAEYMGQIKNIKLHIVTDIKLSKAVNYQNGGPRRTRRHHLRQSREILDERQRKCSYRCKQLWPLKFHDVVWSSIWRWFVGIFWKCKIRRSIQNGLCL